MAEIINLNRFKKERDRAAKAKTADAIECFHQARATKATCDTTFVFSQTELEALGAN